MKNILKTSLILIFVLFLCSCSESNSITISMNAEQDSGYKWVYSVDKKGIINEEKSSVEVLDSSNANGLINSVYHYKFSGNNDGVAIVTFEYINIINKEVKYKIIYKFKVEEGIISIEESSGNFPSKVS